MPTADRTDNDIFAFFALQIFNLFQTGSPTAQVFTDRKPRADVTFRSDHGMVTLAEIFNNPLQGVVCSTGALLGDRNAFIQAVIISESRKTTNDINKRLQDFLDQGRFQDTTITPPAGPVGLIRVTAPNWRIIPDRSNDTNYSILVDFTAFYFRTRQA